ncbi:ADP-ribosylglycohydrolase family protein [Halanaerobium salsuginis]|jgi:ADP-ribosyl-[dinitrogen reductase] hydrolase|uniref:ADP-ribosyl-[dinitrogen reductase] hydrolase n=1 Tax=Halanaerobium salsuginis TaxID=29563 RepID=A0A1I4IF59_9FIRM|nr:ADP-ribosylglycohydrolase family protein [Halanaerobium salsuginis]SFL52431.1 ADP-ribosyl-[dinitrogen reductase] hydrolase [Halanaerobium salsuginis]
MRSTPSDDQELMQEIEVRSKGKAFAAIFGLAIGDALGASVEQQKRDSFAKITEMQAGGPFNLKAGDWTDDTAMALCLAQSLIEAGFDLKDQLNKYLNWYQTGYLSSTGKSFGVGQNTLKSLQYFAAENELPPKSVRAAGNGALMRLAPVAIYYKDNFARAVNYAGKSSLTTHNNQLSIDSCRYLGGVLQQFINARLKLPVFKEKVLLDTAADLKLEPDVKKAVENGLNWERADIRSDGFVIHTLEAAVWAFTNSDSFAEALIKAVNLGEDTDTVAAVTGQLAGAFYGYSDIPDRWLSKLTKFDSIYQITKELYYKKNSK